MEVEGRELQVEYGSDDVYDAIRDAAVETQAALVYLKRRTLSLEDIYLGERAAVGEQA